VGESDASADLPYTIDAIPNKGKGLLATRTIPKGAIIFTEKPLFTQPASCTNSAILSALSMCTRDEQCTFFTLANAHKGGGPNRMLPALGIFETNALRCDDASAAAAERRGLFMTAARLNHACTPNVSRVWDTAAQAMVFRALRRVEPGEELCMNYVDVLGTRDTRRAELQERFGFECACAVCVLEGETLEESDRRRATIRRLYDEVSKCAKEPTLGMRKAKIALRLLKDESLVHYEASFCFDAFQLCVLVSDFANAKAWARRAWEASCSTSGPESPAARTFKMYWANPRAHRSAGMLPRMVLSGPDSS